MGSEDNKKNNSNKIFMFADISTLYIGPLQG